MSEAYVVDVKPSARRASGAVGRAVNEGGSRREFPDRGAAERWAIDLSENDATVWVRDANPNDSTGVDAYLMGWRGDREAPTSGGSMPAGSQSVLEDHARPVPGGWASDDATSEREATQSTLFDHSGDR